MKRFLGALVLALVGSLVGALVGACGRDGPAEAPGLLAELGPTDLAVGARPDVLVVGFDDLSREASRAFGGRHAGMPALDRLAAEGVVFRRAVVASPFCTPSRQAFLTGRFPHQIGVTQLASSLAPDATTLATVFAAAGYRTAALGKMHFGPDAEGTYGFDATLDRADWVAELGPDERAAWERYGHLFADRRASVVARYNLEREPLEIAPERQLAAWLVDATLATLERAPAPALVFCSFFEPHVPFTFPPSYADRVAPEAVALPDADVTTLRREVPGIFATWREHRQREGPLGEPRLRALVAGYLQSALWADSQLARLLDGLESTERGRATIVVLWSDHGFFLGEHGLAGKNFPYREILEAPLVLRAPGLAPRTVDALVQTVDVFPTLCALCGVEPPPGLAGASLLPLARGEQPSLRKHAFSEFVGAWSAWQTPRWKLVLGTTPSTGLDQLYDLERDPGETRNLVREPALAPVRAELTAALAAHLRATPPDWLDPAAWMPATDAEAAVRQATARIEPSAPPPGTLDDE